MLHWDVNLSTTPTQKRDVAATPVRWARVLRDAQRKPRHFQQVFRQNGQSLWYRIGPTTKHKAHRSNPDTFTSRHQQ